MYNSRKAEPGENYTTSRFQSGSIGLMAPGDATTAVCLDCGTRLALTNLSAEIQTQLGVQASEQVNFVRIEEGLHHDGVEFSNGKRIPLHKLGVGVGVSLVPVEVEDFSAEVDAVFEYDGGTTMTDPRHDAVRHRDLVDA